MLPEVAGIYLAKPLSWAIAESRVAKLPQFVCELELTRFRSSSHWDDLKEPRRIVAYFALVSREGELIESRLRQIRSSLGWDGKSFVSLSEGDWSNCVLQAHVVQEEFEGRKRWKVRAISPKDTSETGVLALERQRVEELDRRYGQALGRLMADGSRSEPAAPADDPKKTCWLAFQQTTRERDPAKLADAFRKWVSRELPGTDPASLTADQWRSLQTRLRRLPRA